MDKPKVFANTINKSIKNNKDENITKEEAIELIKQRSRKYAKRQYTWNKHQFNVNWFDVDFNNFENTVNSVLGYINKF